MGVDILQNVSHSNLYHSKKFSPVGITHSKKFGGFMMIEVQCMKCGVIMIVSDPISLFDALYICSKCCAIIYESKEAA